MTDASHEPHMDCRGAMKELWDYLDGELTEAKEQAIREHLEYCAPCFEHSEFEQHFLEALAATKDCNCAPPALRDRVVEALRKAGYCPTGSEPSAGS
ncbi:MAG: hypothetical protein NVS1B4_17320 [Gemmatimonadaceae bacterium]